MNTAINIENISKSFPGVLANDSVSFDITSGTIHAIVGENGAGKSTLMKILYGMQKPDNGILKINGDIAKFQLFVFHQPPNHRLSNLHQLVNYIFLINL